MSTRVVKRAYKYRFYPTPEQAGLLVRTFGCVRWVWNRALAERSRAWTQEQKRVTFADTCRMLTQWKQDPETAWLYEVSNVGDAGVDGGPLVAVEQVGLEKDLAVGNGNDVGGDVGRNVARLGFDKGQGGERTGAVVVVELGGALQQAAVQVEDVAGEGFAARRAAQQQGDLAIGGGVLGEIVVYAEGVAFGIAEVLPDGASGEGREILHGGGVGGRGDDDDGVLHGAMVFQGLDHLGDGGAFLADGDIDADHVAALLIDDGIEGECGLAGLAVSNDQLALPPADGDHGIDGLDAGLHGLFDGLAGEHRR